MQTRRVLFKLDKVLEALAEQFVHLENEVGFVTKEFSRYVLKLVGVHDIGLIHQGHYRLNQVLIAFVYNSLYAILKLLRKVTL